jgi:hypothetical protein
MGIGRSSHPLNGSDPLPVLMLLYPVFKTLAFAPKKA